MNVDEKTLALFKAWGDDWDLSKVRSLLFQITIEAKGDGAKAIERLRYWQNELAR